MPVVGINVNDTERYDLKSAPEGFVVIRRMPYGKWLKRQEIALKMRVEAPKKGQTAYGDLDLANRKVTEYEFSECIVDHNLEIADGQPFDFTKSGMLDYLDPKVGNEIAGLITALHDSMEGEEAENFSIGSERA